MEEVDGFDRTAYPLKPAAVELWDGHLFLHLSPARDGSVPARSALHTHLGPLVERFRPWRMADLRLVQRSVYEVQADALCMKRRFPHANARA